MTRIAPIDPALASGRTKELLDDVQRTFGSTPNLFRTAAAAPAALEAMLRFFQALCGGSLSAGLGEQAALEFAESVLLRRGAVPAGDVARARMAGWSDGELVEILAHVALTVFTNYLAIAAQIEIDFPVRRAGEAKAA